jgi:PAS domain S-box-containing protein
VLLGGLLLTGWLSRRAQEGFDLVDRQEYEFTSEQLLARIQKRLIACESILYTGAAFVDHAEDVTRAEWRRFIGLQEIDRRFPGIQGVGVALHLTPQELPRHEATVRAEGFPSYQVWPEGPRDHYSAIIYLEPFADRNLRAFGYDMMSEPVRRAAMERARDENQTALSGKVTLVQETDRNIQAGILMFRPVYRPNAAVNSVAERRAALRGWVYLACRMDDLMEGILADREQAGERRIHVEIFDGPEPLAESLLHDSFRGVSHGLEGRAALTATRTISTAGRTWVLRFITARSKRQAGLDPKAWWVVMGGASTSLLLAGLLFSLRNTQQRAAHLAARLTAEIRASEEKFRAIADYTVGWESWFDIDGRIQWVNPGVERVTGYSPAEILAISDLSAVLVTPHDRDQFNAVTRGTASGATANTLELRCRKKDGELFWLSMSWQPILGADGRALGVRASGRDISELKRAETELRRANLVLDQAHTSIFITDRNGVIEYVNDEFTRSLGYTKTEAVGRNPRFLQSGKTDPNTYKEMWRTLLSGASWQGEICNRRKDGTLIWELLAISPLRDECGEITHFVAIKQDVSERKRLQLALQENLTNFRTFFDTITDLIFVGSPDGKIVASNRAVTDVLGYSAAELAGMPLLTTHPRDRREEAETIFAAMIRGERASCPLPLARKDGTLVPVDTRVWLGQWDGAPCIFGISKNLSAEQEANQRFERLFRHNPALMALTALPEGKFTDVNYSFLRTLGYEARDVIGRTASDLGIFVDPDLHAKAAAALGRDGRLANVELKIRRRDGGILHGIFSGELIRNQGTQYFLTVMIDVTAEREAEKTLRWNRELLELMASSSPLGFLVVDNRTDAVLHCNQRFREIWDIPHLAEPLRRGQLKYHDILPDCLAAVVDAPAFAATCAALQDEANRVVLADEIAFSRGRTIRRFTTQIRDAEDRYYGRFHIFEDITERKRREAETVALLEKEREVSDMKTRFISVTSHEFRTPMAAAVASAELIANYHDRLTPAKRQELLARISKSLRRMGTMLEEILLLNRLEERRAAVTISPVDLQQFLPEIVEEIRLADNNAHRFEIIAAHGDTLIHSDSSALHHIFSNLLSNAVRYSPPDTRITVQLESQEKQVSVVIADQGIGIPPADLVRIFEPFERGSNVGQIQGTGLGLNIVKRITKLLHATIAVESSPEGGARFTVSFPRSKPAQPPA